MYRRECSPPQERSTDKCQKRAVASLADILKRQRPNKRKEKKKRKERKEPWRACQIFSKVSSLVHLLCHVTIERTFLECVPGILAAPRYQERRQGPHALCFLLLLTPLRPRRRLPEGTVTGCIGLGRVAQIEALSYLWDGCRECL